ncbi:hypothetical protein EVAR_81544_1 [Eumeta japonica]|uniref:Uncharacterized protein n=1 Tax=Eumeta variegata TaxID=151549 RepID=A0A4C1UZX2_EUMVA|nr:hypothetical protein EVAR_81544_1 [Eumeta japonica]
MSPPRRAPAALVLHDTAQLLKLLFVYLTCVVLIFYKTASFLEPHLQDVRRLESRSSDSDRDDCTTEDEERSLLRLPPPPPPPPDDAPPPLKPREFFERLQQQNMKEPERRPVQRTRDVHDINNENVFRPLEPEGSLGDSLSQKSWKSVKVLCSDPGAQLVMNLSAGRGRTCIQHIVFPHEECFNCLIFYDSFLRFVPFYLTIASVPSGRATFAESFSSILLLYGTVAVIQTHYHVNAS